MNGHDRLRHCLILGILIGLLARATIFREGGLGSALSVAVAWACVGAVLVATLRQIALRLRGKDALVLKWVLLAAALIPLVMPERPSLVTTDVSLICIAVLSGLGIRDIARKRRET